MPWTPASLSGLAAWYTADAGVTTSSGNVTAVADQSGNGNNLTNTGTVAFSATGFNGFPTFNFLASNAGTLKTTTNGATGLSGTAFSAFAVCQLLSGSNGYGRLICYKGNGQANDFDNAGSCGIILRSLSTSDIAAVCLSVVAQTTISYATNYRLGMVFGGGNISSYVNGSVGVTTTLGPSLTSSGTIFIGSDGGTYWEGPVSEVVITASTIGSTDLASLDTYFVNHWISPPTSTQPPRSMQQFRQRAM